MRHRGGVLRGVPLPHAETDQGALKLARGVPVMTCEKCGSRLKHSERHDAFYCPRCDEWTERKCRDPDCEFCRDRPEKPSDG